MVARGGPVAATFVVLLVAAGAAIGPASVTGPRSSALPTAGPTPLETRPSQSLFVQISVTPTFPEAGDPLSMVATVYGGTGGSYSYSWSGLPPGCASVDGPDLNCTPTGTGQFQVAVTVFNGGEILGAGMATFSVTPNEANTVNGIVDLVVIGVVLGLLGTVAIVYLVVRVIRDSSDRDGRRYAPPPGPPPAEAPAWNFGPPGPPPAPPPPPPPPP
jgi:PKD domain-containing protein